MKRLAVSSISCQRGISKFGLVMLMLIVVSFLTVGLKVAPLYIDHNLLTGLAEELVESGEADGMTVTQVRERFGNTIRLNSITDFDLANIRVARVEGQTTIRIAYERRVPLIANIEIIAVFDNTIP